ADGNHLGSFQEGLEALCSVAGLMWMDPRGGENRAWMCGGGLDGGHGVLDIAAHCDHSPNTGGQGVFHGLGRPRRFLLATRSSEVQMAMVIGPTQIAHLRDGTGSAPSANSPARTRTRSNISGVRRPVKVFCWLTWKLHRIVRPSSIG